MSHPQPEPADTEIVSVLLRNRPEPDEEWKAGLGQRLLPSQAKPVFWRLPQVRVGAALAAGFATLLILLALAGVRPLGGGAPNVRAKDQCETVRVTRVERVPGVVQAPSGKSQVVYTRERVTRFERRCR